MEQRKKAIVTAIGSSRMLRMQLQSPSTSIQPEGTQSSSYFIRVAVTRRFAENALNASQMNVRPGGKQPCTRDTLWAGRVQRMVRDDGVVKGLKAVLEERGINTEGMKGDDMRTVLKRLIDFK